MTSPAAYDIAPDVAHVDAEEAGDGACYAAVLPAGPPVVLRDSAAAIWDEAREGGTVAEIAVRVADAVGLDPADIAADVEMFVEELVGWGLLERRSPVS